MTELDDHITGTQRRVGGFAHRTGQGRTIALRRTYDAPVEEVWSACTEAERISRWLLPISGDLRLGGHYQLEGNAGGEILVCEPPRRLMVTWFATEDRKPDDVSEVEVRLSPTGDGGTLLELEHRATVDDAFWSQFGPGGVGLGWDLSLLALAGHLNGTTEHVAEEKLLARPAGRDFVHRSGEAWRLAHEASGADPAEAKSAAETSMAAYLAPAPAPEESGGDGGDASAG